MATLASLVGEVRRLMDDLSERGAATATGDGSTTSFPLPHQNIIGKSPVLSATPLTSGSQTITDDIINPPRYSIVYVQGNASGITGNVVLTGTDWQDDTATDTIALSGTSAEAGTTYFKTITQVTLPAETHAGTDTVRIYAPSTVQCTIDGVAETGWTADLENGWFTFSAAPLSGEILAWTYSYSQYSRSDILSAVNHAVFDTWNEVPRATTDTASIVADSSTYEYALPSNCLRLIRVEKRASATSPYEKENEWRVIESGSTKTLKLFQAPSPSETIRLHYIAEPGTLDEDSDTLAGAGLPERAKWSVIYGACFYLCENKLLPRVRTNQFKNAEGANVPKVYEIQRVASDFKTLADLEMRKLRIGVKRWS